MDNFEINPEHLAASSTDAFVQWFRSASPYINHHRQKTFVVAFGGEAVSHGRFIHLIHDLALLHSLGIRLILVHGSRPQINQNLEAAALKSEFSHNRRVTDPKILPLIIQSCGLVRHRIEAALSIGVAQSPMQGANIEALSGNLITARPYGIRDGIDFQYTGQVRKVNTQAISRILDQGSIALISHIGYSPTGELFNCAWEEVAEAVACNVQADKLIFLDAKKGLFSAEGNLLRELTTVEADALIAEADNRDAAPLPHLAAGIRACQAGVTRCHFLSYAEDGALLRELFTLDGSGTLLSREDFERIRPATIEDVAGMLELLRPLEDKGILVRRSRERLEQEIAHFILIERDDAIIGCAALYPFNAEQCGELACVVIHPDYRQGQRGDMLLQAIQQQARKLALQFLFVLTTHTAQWFQERGFIKADTKRLPQQKQQLYNWQRNSNVFIKQLSH